MDKQTVHRLESDIAIIKEAMRANNGFIKQFLSGRALSGFFIAFGAVVAFLGIMWHGALSAVGSFSALYLGIKIVLIAVTVVASVAVSVGKIIAIARTARKIDQQFHWLDMVMKLSDHPISIAQGLVVLMSIFGAIIAGRFGASTMVIGIIAGGFAVVFLLYAVAFLLSEYLLISIGLFLVTSVALLWPTASPLLLLAVGIGGVFIICGLVLLITSRRNQ